MKNILRENMRRFRTKNLLSEQTRLDGILQDLRNTDDDQQIAMLDQIKRALWQLESQFYVAAKKLSASSAPEIGANADKLLELLIGFFQPHKAKNSSAGGLDKFGLYGRIVKDLFRDDVDYENDFLRGEVNWYEFSNEAADLALDGELDSLLTMIKDKTDKVRQIIKPELRK